MSEPTKTTILYKNQVTTISNTASCSDTNSTNFPIDNIKDDDVSSVVRTRNETGKKYWTIDFGRNASFDSFGLAGHNFSSGGIFAIGTASNASGDTASAEETSLTMIDNHFIHYFGRTIADRYIKFMSLETTGDGYHEIGEMWLGMKTQLTHNPQIPIDIINERNTTVLNVAGGQRWSYENYAKKGYRLNFIDDVTPEQYASMEAVFTSKGLGKPFFFHLKPGDTNDPVLFVHTDDFSFSIDGKDKRPGNWVIVEEK